LQAVVEELDLLQLAALQSSGKTFQPLIKLDGPRG
jgi:hypothetical protein